MKKFVFSVALAAVVLGVIILARQGVDEVTEQRVAVTPSIVPVTPPNPGPDFTSPEQADKAQDVAWLKVYRQRVLNLLETYASTTPQTQKIWDMARGKLQFAFARNTPNLAMLKREIGTTDLVIVVLSHGDHERLVRDALHATLAHQIGTRLIYAPPVMPSDAILAGWLYHELGHLWCAEERSRAGLPTLVADSNEAFSEEVEMTELEAQVLNAASGGQYLRLIDQLIARTDMSGAVINLKRLFTSVSEFDKRQFEAALGLAGAGDLVINGFTFQLELMLDFRFFDQVFGDPARAHAAKVVAYRAIRQNSKQ